MIMKIILGGDDTSIFSQCSITTLADLANKITYATGNNQERKFQHIFNGNDSTTTNPALLKSDVFFIIYHFSVW